MPRKKEIIRVSTGAPRFRQDTPLMRAHETMVDFIKGGSSVSFMNFLGTGIFEFINNIDVDPDRDLIYSDDDEDDDFSTNFNHQNAKPLEPHPRIKELDDEKAEKQIRDSIEEEEKRKLKAIKNKRKKMRKKEKKRQEKKENEEKKVLSEDEEEKSDSSETEEVKEENTIIDNKKKELNKCTTEALCNKSDIIIKEEISVQITKKIEEKSENLDFKPQTPCITESKQNDKSTQLEKAPEKQSVKVKQPKKEEEPKVNKPVKAQKKEKTVEIKKEANQDDGKEEPVDSVVEEYAKRSGEIAALGNQLAATEQYEMAVKCFTDAIKLNPKEYKLFGNRSFCFEKLQQYESALGDAEVSLSMEPNWVKGLFRKGKALCGLKKYYEATLVFKEVLKLESSSQEAMMELKRAQTLHLMEMGFTWAQSSSALKKHATLEEAIEALFTQQNGPSPKENGACKLDVPEQQATHQNSNREEEEWIVLQSTRPKLQTQLKGPVNRQSLSSVSRNQAKPELFPVWVGSLASTVTYATLYEVFNRAGKVVSIKMVLEHECAFVNYIKMEDADRAVHTINGMVLEGCPLSVRYPSRFPPGIGVSKYAMTDPLTPSGSQKKECFFWRTIGCTRNDCTFKHFPENKGINREKYTSKVPNSHYAT